MNVLEKIDSFLSEQNEYQTFFKEMLEKEEKSIGKMSDAEKKTFFEKIKKEWAAKKKSK